MNFIVTLPLLIAAFTLYSGLSAAPHPEAVSEIKENVDEMQVDTPRSGIAIRERYTFTPSETYHLLMFFLINLRPWQQRIPQSFIDFINEEPKGSSDADVSVVDRANSQVGEGETNGQPKVSFRVNFLHKVFKSAGRKKMKKTIKKKKHICTKCAAEIENVEENKKTVNNDNKNGSGNALTEQQGQMMLNQFAGQLEDLVSSVIGDHEMENLLEKLQNEINLGTQKGWYSDGAVKNLSELVLILRQEMENHAIPEGIIRTYYTHTMLFHFFNNVFFRFVDQIKPVKKEELKVPENVSLMVTKILDEKPWQWLVIEDKPKDNNKAAGSGNQQKKQKVSKEVNEIALGIQIEEDFKSSRFKQMDRLLRSKEAWHQKLTTMVKIAREVGFSLLTPTNIEIAKKVCETMQKLFAHPQENKSESVVLRKKLLFELNYFKDRLETFLIKRTEKEIPSYYISEKSSEFWDAVKQSREWNLALDQIVKDWYHLLHELELFLTMSPIMANLLHLRNINELQKLEQFGKIGKEVIITAQSAGFRQLQLQLLMAYHVVLQKLLDTLEIDYERERVNNLLQKVKELQKSLEEANWYPSSYDPNPISMPDGYDWRKIAEEDIVDLISWLHPNESLRYLAEQGEKISHKIEVLLSIVQKLNLVNKEEETVRARAIEDALIEAEVKFKRLMTGNHDNRELNEFKAIVAKIGEYRMHKNKTLQSYDKMMKDKKNWEQQLISAKGMPEMSKFAEASNEVERWKEEDTALSKLFSDIITKTIPSAGQKLVHYQTEQNLTRAQQLIKIKQCLTSTKFWNKWTLSMRRGFLSEQNALINETIKQIEDFLNREPICLNKIEEAKANYEDAKEKLKKKEAQLNKQIGDVQNHFMLLKLFELEQRHFELLDEFNARMEQLAIYYTGIIMSIQTLKGAFEEQRILIDVLKEKEAMRRNPPVDATGMEMRYRMVLDNVQKNQKSQREALSNFFNGYNDDIIRLSHIQPIANTMEQSLFDSQFTLAEAVTFIHYLSNIQPKLDLLNNPTGIIDILTDKLNEVLAKLDVVKTSKPRVDYDFLSDFARNPEKNENPNEYYERMAAPDMEEVEAKLKQQELQNVKKPLQSAILSLIAMLRKLNEMASRMDTNPKQLQHQIVFVEKPILVTIPLFPPNDNLTRGKFLLYSLFSFGECLVQEFKSNEQIINRLLKMGIRKIREDPLMRNKLAMEEVTFRSVEFERNFVENFVSNIFVPNAFDVAEKHEEWGNDIGNDYKMNSLKNKWEREKWESEMQQFKRNLRKEMCQFGAIRTDESIEDSIQLLDDTIKKLYYQPKIVRKGPPAPPPVFNGLGRKRKGKFNSVPVGAIHFLNGGFALTVKSRLSKSIWKDYPDKDPIDTSFDSEIRKRLISMFEKIVETKLSGNAPKAVYPYEQNGNGIRIVMMLKDLVKLNLRKLDPEEHKLKRKQKKEREKLEKAKAEKALADIAKENGQIKQYGQQAKENDQNIVVVGSETVPNEQPIVSESEDHVQEQPLKRQRTQKEDEIIAEIDGTQQLQHEWGSSPIEPRHEHGNVLNKLVEANKKRKKRNTSMNGAQTVDIHQYDINEFFAENIDVDNDSDEEKIPLKALQIYRLLRSIMANTFNTQIDDAMAQIAKLSKPNGFPSNSELELFLDPKVNFKQLTDELDQFCFLAAHSKRNVHAQIKVLYYKWTAHRAIAENSEKLKVFNLVIKTIKKNERTLKRILYRLVDYTNYINQFTDGFQHAYGFSLKSLNEFLIRKKNFPGGVEFRIADLLVHDFIARKKFEDLEKLQEMEKEIHTITTINTGIVSLGEIQKSLQEILELRLNLLTEIAEKTKDSEDEETNEIENAVGNVKGSEASTSNAMTVKPANAKKNVAKDWRLGRKEAAKHIETLKEYRKDEFHEIINRRNNFKRQEELLRDYFCYDSCQSQTQASQKFDFIVVLAELRRAIETIRIAMNKYEDMKKKEIALQKAYVKGKKSTNNSNNAIATNNDDPNELKNAHAKIKEKRKLREEQEKQRQTEKMKADQQQQSHSNPSPSDVHSENEGKH